VKSYVIFKRSEIFTAMKFQVEIFWVVTLCSDGVGYPEGAGSEVPCCLHLQGEVRWCITTSHTASQLRRIPRE